MDTTAFTINFSFKGRLITAEIRPCCREDNIVDYAVWVDDKLEFTVTRAPNNNDRWVIALKNADDQFDDEMIQTIGAEITARNIKA